MFETFRPPNKISHFLKELKLYIVHQEIEKLHRFYCVLCTGMLVYLLQKNPTKQKNKQTKIKFTHLVDDLQNCLDLKRKNKVNNYFKINDYKMPSQKSTLCALFMDQMTTRKQNENKKKTNKQQQHQRQQIKIDMTILKFSSQRQKH